MSIEEQLAGTEARLAREISDHSDTEAVLRSIQFIAVNGQNANTDANEALREIENRARQALATRSS